MGRGAVLGPLSLVAHWLRWALSQNWEGSLPTAQTPSQGCPAPLGWGPQLPLETELFVLGRKQPSGLGQSQNRKGTCAEQVEELNWSAKGCRGLAGIMILQLRQQGTCKVGVLGLRRGLGSGGPTRGGVREGPPAPTGCVTLDPSIYLCEPTFPHH